LGYKTGDLAGYTNHYNSELKKCFILVETTDAKTTPGTIWTNKFLSDAHERKVYGAYSWRTDKVKKYWEVPLIGELGEHARRRCGRCAPKRRCGRVGDRFRRGERRRRSA
jgi:hypothetical protein